MRAFASFLGLFLVVCSCLVSAQEATATPKQTAAPKQTATNSAVDNLIAQDIAYRVALYEYNTGEYQKALMVLSSNKNRVANDSTAAYREILKGRLNIKLNRYVDAQNSFDRLSDSDLPKELLPQVLFPIAELNFAKGNCQKALETLGQISVMPAVYDLHSRFVRVSCMVKDSNEVAVVQNAERILLEGVSRMKVDKEKAAKEDATKVKLQDQSLERAGDQEIWLSYAYFNLATAMGQKQLYDQADRLFVESLKYVGATEEGIALREKINISLAYTNFLNNRYDYSTKYFSKLPLDGGWVDMSLLGYGWAAFKNYKPDVALEAWRQLVNLPYKSMSVYEGYLAIPFALERANSFTDSLVAYEKAIEEYTKVLVEIDELVATISLKQINDHAMEYANAKNTVVKPLHPLLAYTYIKENFRVLIETMGEIGRYQSRLAEYENNLQILSEARRYQTSYASLNELKRQQKSQDLQVKLDALKIQMQIAGDSFLQEQAQTANVNADLKGLYARYVAVSSKLNAVSDSSHKAEYTARLWRLRSVLLFKIYEANNVLGKNVFAQEPALQKLTSSYNAATVRLATVSHLNGQKFDQVVSDSQLLNLQVKIGTIKSQSDEALLAIQIKLLEMTLAELEQQKQIINVYLMQARVATVRLKEEFFQKGGRRL